MSFGHGVIGAVQQSERNRVAVCTGLGAASGALLALFEPWQLALLAGWDVAAATLVGLVWWSIGGLDADQTRDLAKREDDSRAAAGAVVVVACFASVAGVFVGIREAREQQGMTAIVLMASSIVAVMLAWLSVHITYTLHYAHHYYDNGGGIQFSGNNPTYVDFAYLAFTVGMTFQVSDTEITSRAMRVILLRHAALAYVLGTVIIGVTINVIAGLLG